MHLCGALKIKIDHVIHFLLYFAGEVRAGPAPQVTRLAARSVLEHHEGGRRGQPDAEVDDVD